MTMINDILTRIFLRSCDSIKRTLRFQGAGHNRGATYNQYSRFYWNDPQREIHRNSSRTIISAPGKDVPNWLSWFNSEPPRLWGDSQYNNGIIHWTDIALMTTRKPSTFKNRNKLKRDTTAQPRRLYNIASKSNAHQEVTEDDLMEITAATTELKEWGTCDLRPEVDVMRV